jgi:two-component system, NarL family, response regulator NreC
MAKTRIIIADGQTMFREGIRAILSSEADMEMVGEASNGGEAIAKAAEFQPDLVLMDIGMAGISCFEATRQIRKARPETKVVLLTMYEEEDYLIEGMDAGAGAYVLKDTPSSQLVAAIRDVCRGGSYVSPRMLSRFVDHFRSRTFSPESLTRSTVLTPREREVLKMLAEGDSVKEIACHFDLSVKTVEAHKFNLMRKLDIHNKARLVQYAIQKKVIRIPTLPFA